MFTSCFIGFRKVLPLTTLALAGFATPLDSAFAQDAPDEDLEEIVVTGSRIGRDPNLGAPVPVQSVSAEDIRLAGESDVTEVVRDLPALLTTTAGDGSIDGVFSSSVGQSILQLRGMGAERTLVLVNSRRHVAGVAGAQSVDINTIPSALIERVDVLTGGASAIYGADAVTGVVNFILRDDFEGFQLNANAGISGEGDGGKYSINGIYGVNFLDDRANVTIAVDYSTRDSMHFGDREEFADGQLSRDMPNPALRFQNGDIGASTPNFAAFYDVSNGFYPIGFTIPTADEFVAAYTDAFGVAPTLTAEELALIDRAATAPLRAILPQPNFSISSNAGVIVPGDFQFSGLDLDNNGVEDCLDSFVGFNSLFESPNAFGAAGGCWVIEDDGSVRPYRDGLVSSLFNQFGPEGIQDHYNADYLVPKDDRVTVNLMGHYDFTESMSAFGEFKYVTQETDFGGLINTFYDLLTIAPDNPFIPEELQQLANDRGGLFITRDLTDMGPNVTTNERETFRFVGGIEGAFANDWNYELSGNFGTFTRTLIDRNAVIMDRFFAAIDVTTDASGNPICRSDIDPGPYPTTPFGIPPWDSGYFTFNPGDGTCVPANILGGPVSLSQEAVDWISTTDITEFEIDQLVFSAIVDGDLGFGLDAGDIAFAAGAEWREEKSSSTFSPLSRGVLPITTPDGNAGDLVRDLPQQQNSLLFDPGAIINNSSGSYDVWEVFGEVEVPLLVDAPFARELTLNAAARYSDYSTIGNTVTWQTGVSWAPVRDIRFRGTVSEAVRAPNIFELFEPDQGATFRPDDPCEQDAIDALIADGDPRGPIREANCRADGIPEGFTDPLSARFFGVVSGNPDLTEEEAETLTFGFVFQPEFLQGLTLSVDYYDIEISSAISGVGSQEIVDNCYDSANFPNQFCGLFTRVRDPASPQFLGFNFLRQTQINFGKIASSGIDFTAAYTWDMADNTFAVRLSGSRMDELDFFFDPGDPTAVDDELREIQRPELAGNVELDWVRGPLLVRWHTHYQDEQTQAGVEIDDIDIFFGPAGMADSFAIHDLSFAWDFSETLRFNGGIRNVTEEKPFITQQAYPVDPRGRFFFVGASWSLL